MVWCNSRFADRSSDNKEIQTIYSEIDFEVHFSYGSLKFIFAYFGVLI